MSNPSVPDACTLTPPEFGERLHWIRAEILPHAKGREDLEDGVAWRFEAGASMREKLERLVALESQCCDPEAIRFALHEEPAAGTLRLEVHGIDPESMLLATAPPAGERPSALKRALKAGGTGAVGSFAVFCVLPIGVAAIAGASVAAPLAGLESPATLAGGTLAFGAAAWWLLRRRETRRGC